MGRWPAAAWLLACGCDVVFRNFGVEIELAAIHVAYIVVYAPT